MDVRSETAWPRAAAGEPFTDEAPASERWTVWAPKAQRVDLIVDGQRIPAQPVDGREGIWAMPAPPPDVDYAVSLDGGPPRPDPRSPWQPRGVHGPSRRPRGEWPGGAFPGDLGDLAFRAPPLGSAIIYELHVGTFTPQGTFEAAIDRLDHLVDLGVTHVELMPVAAFPGRHGWGYDGVGLYAVHEPYGGPVGLRRFVAACHARGLAVLLDVVYNHLGPDGNYLGELGPYFTERHRTPWGAAVNLDGPGSDEVRRFVVDNALHWLRHYRLDGLRLDAVHALHDESATHLLEELALAVDALAAAEARPLVLIAESDQNDPRIVRDRAIGGFGLDGAWADDFHHAVHAVLTGERAGYYGDYGAISQIADALRRGFVYDGRYSPFRGRRHGRPLGDVSGHHLIACLQNHDQVGNRARGERLGQLVAPGRLHAAAALLFTAPMVPMIFQGEEWNASSPFQYFTDHESAELAEAVRRGRREEHAHDGLAPEDVPDPQDVATYERSQLVWEEREQRPHASTLAWYRALAALRRCRPELLDGRFDRVSVEALGEAIVVVRGGVTVVANFGGEPVELVRPSGELALGEAEPHGDMVRVPAASAAIWTT